MRHYVCLLRQYILPTNYEAKNKPKCNRVKLCKAFLYKKNLLVKCWRKLEPDDGVEEDPTGLGDDIVGDAVNSLAEAEITKLLL